MPFNFNKRKQRDMAKSINLGLEILLAVRPKGGEYSRSQIAIYCGCNPESIRVIEARALRKAKGLLMRSVAMCLLLMAAGCAVSMPLPVVRINSNWDFRRHLEEQGWDVYVRTNGLIYENGGCFGVEVRSESTGGLVGWMSNDRFLKMYPTIDWVHVILQGKPKHLNPDFDSDHGDHPEG